VIIGPEANLWFGVVIRGDIARITLGPRVNLQDGVMVHTDHDAPQDIEEGVVAGHGAILHGRRVGKDSLIGIGSTLLSGSDIGAESIVAAGTLIPQDKAIPPRSLVMGVPGKIVRAVTDEEVERTRRIAARYLELARKYAQGEFPPPWNNNR
jgi:carbonic anhydrase/acetyltransferase-like protein (isoleucine patch superfamily)